MTRSNQIIDPLVFDDPNWYGSVHETIRDHHKPTKRVVALCFDCMSTPRVEPKDENDFPQRCEMCHFKHTRRMKAAAAAKGGFRDDG